MPKSIQKTILITGASSGIGKAIALDLAKQGVKIIGIAHRLKPLQTLKREIESQKGVCEIYKMDLGKPSAVKTGGKWLATRFPKIDWIIHNAGTIESGKKNVLGLSEQEIRHVLQVNLLAPYELTKNLWPALKKGKGGVIHVGSTAALKGHPKFPFYSASKAGLLTLVESLARSELFSSKIVLNIIPGPTNTPMRQKIAKDAHEHQPPQVIADAVRKIVIDGIHPETGSSMIIKNSVSSLLSR